MSTTFPITAPADVLTTIARPLVVTHRYPSIEDALREMALFQVRRKMGYYRQRIRTLERKHGADLASFGARLAGRATPAEEDEWLEWRSANGMLADWQRAYEEMNLS